MFHCSGCQQRFPFVDDDTHLVRREQQDICTRRVHLVTLTRVDGLLLDRLDLKGLQLLIEDLTLTYTSVSLPSKWRHKWLTKSMTTDS